LHLQLGNLFFGAGRFNKEAVFGERVFFLFANDEPENDKRQGDPLENISSN
jgi:hypothetical protein